MGETPAMRIAAGDWHELKRVASGVDAAPSLALVAVCSVLAARLTGDDEVSVLASERASDGRAPQTLRISVELDEEFTRLLDRVRSAARMADVLPPVDRLHVAIEALDLHLSFTERDDGLELNAVEHDRVPVVLEQLAALAAGVAFAPDRAVAAHALAGGTCAPGPMARAYDGPLAHEQLGRHDGARPAVRDGRVTYTYAELDERSGRVATWLVAHGVRKGDVIAVHARRSAELVVALLGVWKAGAAFAILDAAYPTSRLVQQVEVARPRALLSTGADMEAGLVAAATNMPCIDLSVAGALDGFAPTQVAVLPTDRAYVAFTSGTTGAPKGIVGTHAPLAHFLSWHVKQHALSSGDRFAMTSGLSHDPLLRDIFAPLWLGAVLEIPDAETLLDPTQLAAWVRDAGVTVLHLTPSLGGLLADGATAGELALRWTFFAGEPLTTARVRELRRVAPRCRVVNFYGATETPQAMASYVVPEHPKGARVPVGAGIDGVELLVLDREGRIAAVGEVGELVVRTPHLTAGYVDPRGDDRRFVRGLFTADDRAYRTGDLGRRLPDGNVECLGRSDEQVKIRGFRVEPADVEVALRAEPGVRDAAVVATRHGDGLLLVAYAVGLLDGRALREALADRLPAYLVPSVVVVIDAIPRTPNGKVDRRALPAPRLSSGEHVPASTHTEAILAGVWSELLEIEPPSVEQSFFELGGDSLLATRVLSRVRRLLGVALPTRALFETRTIRALARLIDAADATEAESPVSRAPRTARLPASYAQERLWFLDKLEPGSRAYHLPLVTRLKGDLDVVALERALNDLVARHEALRTTLVMEDGELRQVIHESRPRALVVETLARDALAARMDADASAPFDLTTGPLVRAHLYRTALEEHVLLLAMHHIVSDGWSNGVLLRDLAALYTGGALAPLAVQYADWALWQRERRPRRDHAERYWRQQLADAPALVELPTDRPLPSVRTHAGATVAMELDREQTTAIRRLAREHDATPFMVLLAAWQALLGRYSGQKDIVVGSPIANRTTAEVEPVVGFFVNVIALRTDLSDRPTFVELLERVRETTLTAYEHQEVPFERVVAIVNPTRVAGRTPLFQVMFSLENVPGTDMEMGRVAMRQEPVAVETAKYDLSLDLVEREETFVGALEYATELFDPSTVRELGDAFRVLLRSATSAPWLPIGALALVDGVTRQALLALGGGRPERPQTEPFALVRAHAGTRPDALAVAQGTVKVSYAELVAAIDEEAASLRREGVRSGARVVLRTHRTIDGLVAMLAVHTIGAAWVPLDPELPDERMQKLIADSGAMLVVGDRSSGIPRYTPVTAPARPCDDEAYVIYTSGSTGTPKGVVMPRAALTDFITDARKIYALTSGDRLLQFAAWTFDVSVEEIFATLSAGAALHLREGDLPGPDRLLAFAAAEGLTALDLPTAYFHVLADALEGGLALPPCIRIVIIGGEAVQTEAITKFRRHVGDSVRLVNAYGPTEAVVMATTFECRGSNIQPRTPIGRPRPGLSAHVVDESGGLVPRGASGELWLGGELARGYLGRADQTAERFVPDPFSERGDRAYRTGDLVRWRADGELEYLGRVDQQVKVRGFRIELGEIEAVLLSQPGVREAAVAVWSHDNDKQLVAYTSGTSDPEALKAALARALPAYMVPVAFVILDALPLTTSGKVDRRALPGPVLTSAAYVEPRTEHEHAVADIFRTVLRVERVGAHDDFFALGGHSLLAIRVIALLSQALDLEVTLRELFDTPTVAGLAARVGVPRATRVRLAVVPSDRSGDLPLMSGQAAFTAPYDAEGRFARLFHIVQLMRVEGPLDPEHLSAALSVVIGRHEALRTTYHKVGATIVCRVGTAVQPLLSVEELHEFDEAERDATLLANLRTQVLVPFDLARGPLIRALVLRASPTMSYLVLVAHHIAVDGWAFDRVVAELLALHAERSTGRPAPPSPPLLQQGDVALWEREMCAGLAGEEAREYWRRQLAGAPTEVALPLDRPRDGTPARARHHEQFLDDVETTELLSTQGRLFSSLWGALATTLALVSGELDIVIGSLYANRDRRNLELVVASLVNFVALRARFQPGETLESIAARLHAVTLDALDNGWLPFGEVVSVLNPAQRAGRNPLYNVCFHLLDAPPRERLYGPLRASLMDSPLEAPSYRVDLFVTVALDAGRLRIGMDYDSLLFDAATVARIADGYAAVLGAWAHRRTTTFEDLEQLMATPT